jgi:GxxExxY protein
VHEPIDQEINRVSGQIVDSAIKIHTLFGPGLLESAYKLCLAHELSNRGLSVRVEVGVPVVYEGLELERGYRLDMLVQDLVIVEVKAVDALHPIHTAQLITYLKLSEKRVGLLLNFQVMHMKEGIKRVVV